MYPDRFTSVLIGEHRPLLREGFQRILSYASDIRIGGEAASVPELLRRLREDVWDVLVLGLAMPARGARLDLLREVRRTWPNVGVVVMPCDPEESYGRLAVQAGAAGCLSQLSAPDEIAHAIRCVAAGLSFISPALAQAIACKFRKPPARASLQALSDREFAVLLALARGESLTAIARRLLLSVKTVSTYRTRILNKLDMKTNAELTAYALLNGLLDGVVEECAAAAGAH